MPRRVFISYQHLDQAKAKGFNLMRYSKNVDLHFVGRHLLDPVNSNDATYITRKIKEQIKGSSATVVLIGSETASSDWVDKEITWSLEKNPPNGIVGIRLDKDAIIPERLIACGAEILDWYKPEDSREFQSAIGRAAAARTSQIMPVNSRSTCTR